MEYAYIFTFVDDAYEIIDVLTMRNLYSYDFLSYNECVNVKGIITVIGKLSHIS